MATLNDYQGFYGSVNTNDELDAVNDILGCIGENNINSLDNNADSDIINARRILYEENRKIQSRGWAFNLEESATLSPDSRSGYIKYLPSYLKVLSVDETTIYINKNGNVYDTSALTDRFSDDITVNMIVARALTEMPFCFREYIVASAAYRFNSAYFGDTDIANDLRMRMQEARIDCNVYELDFARYSLMDNTQVSTMATWG